MKRYLSIAPILLVFASALAAQGTYSLSEDLAYKENGDSYEKERCLLDLYAPSDSEGFATLVWFHGGGLKNGNKHIPERFKNQGIAVVAPNYRFYPKAKATDSILDAAAAVAWVFENISEHGGDPDKLFISGHSAGGYLAAMITYDVSYLQSHGFDANDIAGVIPYSGQTVTHSTIRESRGLGEWQVVADRFAPIHYVRSDAPPTLLMTGDRELELSGRHEENALFWSMLESAGHPDVTLYEFDGYGHDMLEPGHPVALRFIERVLKNR